MTFGLVSSTTVTVCVTTLWLPALSRAVTVTETSPSLLVSSVAPSGVVPTHEARPEPSCSSLHEKSTTTWSPCPTWSPFAGVRRSMVGAVVSQAAVPVSVIL